MTLCIKGLNIVGIKDSDKTLISRDRKDQPLANQVSGQKLNMHLLQSVIEKKQTIKPVCIKVNIFFKATKQKAD